MGNVLDQLGCNQERQTAPTEPYPGEMLQVDTSAPLNTIEMPTKETFVDVPAAKLPDKIFHPVDGPTPKPKSTPTFTFNSPLISPTAQDTSSVGSPIESLASPRSHQFTFQGKTIGQSLADVHKEATVEIVIENIPAISRLQEGMICSHYQSGQLLKKQMWLEKARNGGWAILWSRATSRKKAKALPIRTLSDILEGKMNIGFEGSDESILATRCFTLYCPERTLNIVMETERDARDWIDSLKSMLMQLGATHVEHDLATS